MRALAAVPAVAVLAGGMAIPVQAATETDYFTYLEASSRYAAARGDSEFEREGTRREVEVTVTGIRLLAGHRVVVYVSGHRVGTMLVSTLGRAHRDWSTAHGQSVPSAGTGSSVQVRTAGRVLIASGKYRMDRGD